MTSRRTPLLSFTLVAALAVAACSGSESAATTSSAAPGTTAPTGSDPVPSTEPGTTTAPTTTVALAEGDVSFTKAVTGLVKPVDIAFRGDDPTMYVAQQDGRVVLVRDGAVGATVLDLSGSISTRNEQGLLGIAFHPTDPFVYVDWTNSKGDTEVTEYRVAEDGTFDTGSARTVLNVDQPYANHNGGELTFGPDGMLYIGLGDGGSGGDPQRHALDLGSMLGKILRIDPRADGDRPYTVPADNPFVGQDGAQPEIWSYGLRNPWRFDFDAATGDLWIADVGQNQWEEVDHAPASAGAGKGASFGWSALEGTHEFNPDQSADGALAPIWEYPHGDEGCSVSGGTVYRGSTVPSLVGWYVVADYCSGNVWALRPAPDGSLGSLLRLGTVPNPSAVVQGPGGDVFVLAHGEGALYLVGPA